VTELLQEELSQEDFERAGLPRVLKEMIRREKHAILARDLLRKYHKVRNMEDEPDRFKYGALMVGITTDKNGFTFTCENIKKETLGMFTLGHTCTIRKLKKKIWRLTDIPIEEQILAMAERTLGDNATLDKCGLMPNKSLILWRKRPIINFRTQSNSLGCKFHY